MDVMLETWMRDTSLFSSYRAVSKQSSLMFEANATYLVGKILQDDKTVESYNIQEKDFLVCLPSKVGSFPRKAQLLLVRL